MDHMREVADVSPPLAGVAAARVARMMAALPPAQPFDRAAGRAEFDALLAGLPVTA
jgi:hypothetical protein